MLCSGDGLGSEFAGWVRSAGKYRGWAVMVHIALSMTSISASRTGCSTPARRARGGSKRSTAGCCRGVRCEWRARGLLANSAFAGAWLRAHMCCSSASNCPNTMQRVAARSCRRLGPRRPPLLRPRAWQNCAAGLCLQSCKGEDTSHLPPTCEPGPTRASLCMCRAARWLLRQRLRAVDMESSGRREAPGSG